jgi:hypothetical protein
MEDLKNVLKENLGYYIDQEKIITSRLSVLPKGRIKEKNISGDTYYYLQYRKGSRVIDQYIGKEIPEPLSENLKERKQLEIQLKKVREAIKLLDKKTDNESDFIEPIKQILSKLTEIGLWESGIEIIGSWCFLIYQKYLPLENYPLKTQDIDILIPLPYTGKAFDFSSFFRKIGFKEHFNPDGSMFFSTPALKVEFLAPKRGKGDKSSQFIKDLAVSPQLLRFMDILLKEPFTLRVSRSINVRLPSPSSFFLHKLLISTRSNRKNKQEKDLKQAIYIGKFIIMENEEREKLIMQWKSFPTTWKNRVKRAIQQSNQLLPLETSFIRQIEKFLT